MSIVDNGQHSKRGVPIGVSHSREPKLSSIDGQAAITRVILER
ncbi:hypothetical protein [Natronorubrum sulfidifaciens]|nr:hypothetical protein [Natronorubrum sulfidifaciens]